MLNDFRHAARTLVKNAGFSLIVGLTLALGLGANAAMFSVVDAVVLHPLSLPNADRLMTIFATSSREGRDAVSYPNYLDLRVSRTFDVLAIWKPEFFNLTEGGRTEQLVGQRISADYLTVLDTPPVLGRAFTADDDLRNAPQWRFSVRASGHVVSPGRHPSWVDG